MEALGAAEVEEAADQSILGIRREEAAEGGIQVAVAEVDTQAAVDRALRDPGEEAAAEGRTDREEPAGNSWAEELQRRRRLARMERADPSEQSSDKRFCFYKRR